MRFYDEPAKPEIDLSKPSIAGLVHLLRNLPANWKWNFNCPRELDETGSKCIGGCALGLSYETWFQDDEDITWTHDTGIPIFDWGLAAEKIGVPRWEYERMFGFNMQGLEYYGKVNAEVTPSEVADALERKYLAA